MPEYELSTMNLREARSLHRPLAVIAERPHVLHAVVCADTESAKPFALSGLREFLFKA